MTALDKYVRLEAMGRWREGPTTAPREVVVSFGDATLVLTDLADRPLGHWALAGVQAVDRVGEATVYAMSPEGEETLAIADRDMIEAIAAVTRAHRLAPRAVEAKSRAWIPALLAAVLVAAAIAWAPTLVRDQAARMMPPEAAEAFGDQMLLQIMAATGPPCADPAGRQALAALAAKVADGMPFRLRAVDLGPAPVALLPGPTVAVGRAAIERAEDPAEIAGWIAAALAREADRPGPERMMTAVGPIANLRYVFTGALSEAAIARATRAVFDPPTPDEIAGAYARLFAAGIAAGPFADGLRRAGIAPPPASSEGAPALADRDWVALQGLCSGG